MANQPTNNPPPGGEMALKSTSDLAERENSSKKALHPSNQHSHRVASVIAAVHAENSSRINYFAPDSAILGSSGDILGFHTSSQGGSENSSISPRDQSSSNLASRNVSVNSASFSPTIIPREEAGDTDHSLTSLNVQTVLFHNVPKPIFRVALPKVGDRFTSTLQLAFGQHLLSMNPPLSTPTSGLHAISFNYVHEPGLVLNDAEKTWKSDIEKDLVEQNRARWLVTRVATEFINCANKDMESVAEVVLLGSFFDPNICHRVISSLVGQLESEGLLNINHLQALVQLLQEAPLGSLIDDDLVRVLRFLWEQLMKTYRALGDAEHAISDHIYQLSNIVCRILDIMIEGNIRDLSRAEDHKPLLDLLVELNGSPDPYLKFHVSYAWQALQYVGDDESPLHAVFRIGNGAAIAALSVTSAFKFDIESLLKGLDVLAPVTGQAFDAVKAEVEGEQVLRKDFEEAMENLLKGFRSGSKRRWYPALQAARMYVRHGRLADFQQVIYEAPCRCDPEFQWGICQLLGEIAIDPIWAIENRQQAVNLLDELYRSEKGWITDPGTKMVILGILRNISINTEHIIQDPARVLLQGLTASSTSSLPRTYPLNIRMSLPAASPLLGKSLEGVALEYELRRMMTRCHEEYCQTVYIPPQAKASLSVTDKESFPLMDRIEEFLSSDREVFLVLGDSGAGKSTFNRHLERVLWEAYKAGDQIPLFIDLPTLKNPENELITKYLKNYDFSKPAIQELKRDRQFILICDGYDEAQLSKNLHSTNMFNRSQQWNVKMIISCRSAYLGQNYQARFEPQPIDQYKTVKPHLFQEAVIVPFSSSQIEDYVEQFVQETKVHEQSNSPSVWSSERYMNTLKAIPNLMELVKNPFLLALSLKTLPDVAKDSPDFANLKLTRLNIYDAFICQWANVGKVRLRSMPLKAADEELLEEIIDDGFSLAVINFLKSLAASIFQEQNGHPLVEYNPRCHKGSWKNRFFGTDPEPTFLRQSSPLARVGNQHLFIHHSLLEYFYSRHIFDAEAPLDITQHPLSQRNLVKQPAVIQFLAERAHCDPTFEKTLLQAIELSKSDRQASQAAANAITILVKAGIPFNSTDLQGIKIPGADLSDGHFDSAQLQGADLRDTNLRNVWLRQADLSKAQMVNVDFGELPYLQEDSAVRCCAYSQDGMSFVLGIDTGGVFIYNTTTWVKTISFSGHTNRVTSVMFSPSGQQIVSGSRDNTVRLWNAHTGAPGAVLIGHSDFVRGVAFSPCGLRVASCSRDQTVRIWDVQTGSPGLILRGHTGMVTSVMFSRSGQQIVSGGADTTVRLWNSQTGTQIALLSGHSKIVTSVAFSPSDEQIASGSSDHTVRLWDARTGTLSATLSYHTDKVWSVAYSPNGQQVASGSWDDTVRLWDAQTGAPGPILGGHTDVITSVAFSPKGEQIASGSFDKKARLWNAHVSVSSTPTKGHTSMVTSVAYSPCGQQILSGSRDNTMRLWDTQAGAPGIILCGHTDVVTSAVFSPSGQQIVSGSRDSTIRLWDTQTGAPGIILRGHTKAVTIAVYSPNGQQIASGSCDHTIRFWSAQTGKPSATLCGHTNIITSMAFAPSGLQIASASLDNTVRLWSTETNAPGVILNHNKAVTNVAFSPCGQQIASSCYDNMVRLWDLHTASPTSVVLDGHTDIATCVAFSPSGQLIASGSRDSTVRLWATNLRRCLAVIKDFQGEITSIAWSPKLDNIYFVTGCRDRSVRMWLVEKEEERVLVRLRWSSTHDYLALSLSVMLGVEGLSKINEHLLEQRGAMCKSLDL